jgi:branched-chain amino acid transport system permease protein
MFLVGLAGYTTALVNSEIGLPVLASIVVAVAVTGVFGTLILAGPSVRLSGVYFVTLTLIVPLIAERLVIIFSDLTGGVAGYTFLNPLSSAIPDGIAGLSMPILQYYLIFAVFLLTLALLVVMKHSEIGTILRAIHQDELLLETQGVDPTRFKLVSFGVTAALVGLAASLWTHYQVVLAPASHLNLAVMVDIIVASIIGGIGTVTGSALGMFILRAIEEALRNVEGFTVVSETLGIELVEFRRLITMFVALGFFYFYPRGIYPRVWGAIRKVGAAFSREGEQ